MRSGLKFAAFLASTALACGALPLAASAQQICDTIVIPNPSPAFPPTIINVPCPSALSPLVQPPALMPFIDIGIAAGAPELFAQARIRTTQHAGYAATGAQSGRTHGFNIQEASGLGSFAYTLPGQYFGGSLRLTAVVGQTELNSELTPAPFSGLQKRRVGGSDVHATFYGGSALLALPQSTYVVTTVLGFNGSTEGIDKVNAARFRYDHMGITANIAVGTVVPLGDARTGPKLDLRGVAAYGAFEGEAFTVLNTRVSAETQTGVLAFSPMLFIDIPMGGGAFRPYLQGTVKHLVGYSNELHLRQLATGRIDIVNLDQHKLYLGGELGFNYGINNWTFGTAIYTDQSSSEVTYGLKLGASYRFN